MFNVKGVKTPTMIQHGDADIRVPISQLRILQRAQSAGSANQNDGAATPAARPERAEDAGGNYAGEPRVV